MIRFLVASLALLLLAQCGGAGSMSTTFPEGFAVSSPTAQNSRTVHVRGTSSITSTASRDDKKAILNTLSNATALADCGVALTILTSGNAACYGPSATYANHPDGAPAAGNFPGGDLGIWEAAEASTEGCAAAQLSGRIKGGASYADAGLFGTASMLCAARVLGLSTPSAGSSLDLTSSMSSLISIGGTTLTISAASLAREADSSDGFPVYVSTITGTISTSTYSIRMKHIPTATDNSTYRGKVSISVAAADGTKPSNCSSSSASGHTTGTSVEYEKTASAESYLMKSAQFCGSDADPYVSTSDYTVDLSKKLAGGTPKGWGNNATILAATHGLSSDAGNYAFAWQAGPNDGNVRALNVNLAESSGTETATAFFGFGDDVATSTGAITKMVCNWTGPGSDHTGLTKAQKQVLTRTSPATMFTVSSSNITYDPANACESAVAAFTVDWTNVSGTPTSRAANTTTMNLVDVSTISSTYTTPTAPTDVE